MRNGSLDICAGIINGTSSTDICGAKVCETEPTGIPFTNQLRIKVDLKEINCCREINHPNDHGKLYDIMTAQVCIGSC